MGRPKSAETMENFPVRLPEERLTALKGEAGARRAAGARGDSPSEVVRLHLERYAELVWRDLPRLRDAEWCAVFEALGAVPVDTAAVRAAGTTIGNELDEGDLGGKWKVDAPALAKAARAWTFGQALAVSDAAVRFRAALATPGAGPLEAATEATTRPTGLVLQAPSAPAPKPKAAEASRGRAAARSKRS